ncbi:MAG: hypothetical protein KDK41_09805 [Leptospiraceae bacterium]|nr:hypothetical protein [Leptospiraceae bacterium]MCB1200927.1 hypothetical protein [Leptospiraceae bacterium]
MKLQIDTRVSSSVSQVAAGFQSDLFQALAPPFPRIKLLKFDGNKVGDIVSLELNFLVFKQRWTSKIVHFEEREDLFSFIDIGTELPFFLKSWQHRHHIYQESDNSTIISDQIQFTAPFGLSFLLWPALYLQFLYRKPVYKRIFNKNR